MSAAKESTGQTQSSGVLGGGRLAPPTFATVGEARAHLKTRLAAAFRLFAFYGFDEGAAGHITVRDPEHPDHFWVNPFGRHFSRLTPADLILVNHGGEVVEGEGMVNQAAFAIHSRLHAARPDVTAAAHSHSIYGKALAAIDTPLLPFCQDACAFFEDHVIHEAYSGVVLDAEEGDGIAESLGNKKAAILKNHGLLTVGQTVDSAAWWYIAMERCAQAQLAAMAAGTVASLPPEVARHTRGQVGSEVAGWFSFQPLFEMIAAREPDLFG
ncbi:MAG: class II aldolase/adducin family protein [Pseudomonadales bacterium]|jgi:ribulose-5-phosphate 4-epimerase/fuculose-1-phosphate aldolase|nr:class II aldolase/adducin family protein [Pseudomonadales bacterium]MBL6807788.1 class II aldolase/adducin family protein [Pseudomonadales bacterium]